MLHNTGQYSELEWKGCNIFPVNNNIDGCLTTPVLGASARVVTCYCTSDYCNTGATLFRSHWLCAAALFTVSLLRLFTT